MVSQVSYLHRVRVLMGPAQNQELESFASSSRLGTDIYSTCNYFTRLEDVFIFINSFFSVFKKWFDCSLQASLGSHMSMNRYLSLTMWLW